MKKIMKLTMAITLFTLTFSTAIKAQERTWSIGPELGANFSKFGKDAPDNDFKPGVLGGLFLTYSIENSWAFTGKVLYSAKGAHIKTNDVRTNLNYVEVPLIARYFLTKEGVFRPNIFVGPSLGFLTGASTKTGSGKVVKDPNYTNAYNTFDFGVTAGFGFNFVIANETHFLIDARYTHGLSDVTKGSGFYNNQAIGITAGFSFGL